MKVMLRYEKKLFEKTRGNRQEEIRSFVKEDINESHQQKIKDESISFALQILKISNQIEQKGKTLTKFEDASKQEPSLPFIPNSASNFKLAASDVVKGREVYSRHSHLIEQKRQELNHAISKGVFEVGVEEQKVMYEKRTSLIVEKGLTLSCALEIEFTCNSPRSRVEQPNKCAAWTLLAVLANPNDTYLRAYLQNAKQEDLQDMIESKFRKRGEGTLDLREFAKNMSEEDKADMMIVQRRLRKIIQTVTFRAWEHIIDKQQARITACRINSVYERVKVLSISEATNKILEEEKPVSHKTLDDLIETKIEAKLTKKVLKKVRKNSSGARQSPARKTSKSGKAGNKSSLEKAEKKKNPEETKKKVSFQNSNLKNGNGKQRNANLGKNQKGNQGASSSGGKGSGKGKKNEKKKTNGKKGS